MRSLRETFTNKYLLIITLLVLILIFFSTISLNSKNIQEINLKTRGVGSVNYPSKEIGGKIYFLANNLTRIGVIENNNIALIDNSPELPGEIINNAFWTKDKLLLELINDEELLMQYPGYQYAPIEYYYALYSKDSGLNLLPPTPKSIFLAESSVFGKLGDTLYILKNNNWFETKMTITNKLFYSDDSKYFSIRDGDKLRVFNSGYKEAFSAALTGNNMTHHVFNNQNILSYSANDLFVKTKSGDELLYVNIDQKPIYNGDVLLYKNNNKYYLYNSLENKQIILNPTISNVDITSTYMVSNSKIMLTNDKLEQIKIIEIK